MSKLLIIEDEETIAELEKDYLELSGFDVEIETSGNKGLERALKEDFDLYILDILMPQLSGIETGRRLRALGNGGEIIYLTQSNDFAADSYDVHAFFYLLKPVDQAKFFQILDGAVETLQRRQNYAVVVQTPEGSRRILLDHIRYVERMGRCMRYDCTSGDVVSQTIRVPFREMAAPLLAHRRFFLCGASFVLNFQHVIGVSGQTALLDNGQSITLPRTAASEFKKAWGNYWLEEDGPCWS